MRFKQYFHKFKIFSTEIKNWHISRNSSVTFGIIIIIFFSNRMQIFSYENVTSLFFHYLSPRFQQSDNLKLNLNFLLTRTILAYLGFNLQCGNTFLLLWLKIFLSWIYFILFSLVKSLFLPDLPFVLHFLLNLFVISNIVLEI